MLFDVARDPHETTDLAPADRATTATGAELLAAWTDAQLARTPDGVDPMDIVRAEGGPFHTRKHLPGYLERLRATGRGRWADVLVARHPREADPAAWSRSPSILPSDER